MKDRCLNRRQVTGLLAAGPVLMCPIPVLGAPDYEQELRILLTEIPLPDASARLELVSFEITKNARRLNMAAVIRLTWRPGMRTRKFQAGATNADYAFAVLGAGIESYIHSLA